MNKCQPPSGGCVLKLMDKNGYRFEVVPQPPSGGCVLKLSQCLLTRKACVQPPSGGCVLKLPMFLVSLIGAAPSRLQAAVC